jgi:AcrR family transcriptional regulator
MTEFSGHGDPTRGMQLLWGLREPPSRGPKPGLRVPQIVRAAIEMADGAGLGALSMRRVAELLGVGTMSLYRYVPGKPELLDVMLDTVIAEQERPADVPGGWRGRLELIARQDWALYLRHPWLVQVSTGRPPLGPNLMEKYEYDLLAVDGIGLSDVEMDAVVTLVTGFVQGTARGVVEAAQSQQRSGITDQQWWEAHAPLLERVLDAERFPTASRVGSAAGEQYQAAHDPQHAFEFGLGRILDGIDTLVRSRS